MGDRSVTCEVGVSLHSKIHALFMKYSNGTSTQCYAYIQVSELVTCAFLQSLYLIQIYLLVYLIVTCVCLSNVEGVTACPAEVDAVWQIEWPFTKVSDTAVVSCGTHVTGKHHSNVCVSNNDNNV